MPWTVILRWPDPIYFILIHFSTGPLFKLFSVNVLGSVGTADTPSEEVLPINESENMVCLGLFCKVRNLSITINCFITLCMHNVKSNHIVLKEENSIITVQVHVQNHWWVSEAKRINKAVLFSKVFNNHVLPQSNVSKLKKCTGIDQMIQVFS